MARKTACFIAAAGLLTAGAAAATRPAGAEAIGADTVWRYRLAARGPDGAPAEAELPARGWAAADFDDSPWPARAGPFFGRRKADAVLICLRARFTAAGPDGGGAVRLSLVYRGGAAAYVNGVEVARGDMPSGKLGPLTPATAYPRKVFVTPDGQAVLRDYGARPPPAELADRYAARIRRLTAEVPARLLRRGVNVLAIELHAAPVPADLPPVGRMAWDTVGLESASLAVPTGSGLSAEAPAAAALRVWAAGPLDRWGHEVKAVPPPGRPPALRLAVPRGGFASGQVMLAGAGGKLSAAVRGLKGLIAAVRYGGAGLDYVPLLDAPRADAQVCCVWLTVEAPADAAPGRRTGELRISAGDGSVEVPVEAAVMGWRVPPPGRGNVWVNVLQSPESVAAHYSVPLWSDRHFELMRPSLELAGRLGNRVLGVSAVARSVFGDDPLIVFRAERGRHVPELKFLRRYLSLYDRSAPPPAFLSINVWSYGMDTKGWGRDGGSTVSRAETIPVHVLRGERLVPAELPMYGREGTEELWRDVFAQVRALLGELKWTGTRLLLGTGGDHWPGDQTAAFFAKVAPGVGWRVLTHGCGCPKWGPSADKRTQPNGMVVDYLEMARRLPNGRWSSDAHPVTCNSRDDVGSAPASFRALGGVSILGFGYDGFCWKGMDYWTYTAPGGTRRNALNSYVHFGNMVGGTPRAMAAPGPRGAVATQQIEMLREGTQECEAVQAVRRGLERLLAPPTKKVDLIELFLDGALFQHRRDGTSVSAEPSGRELELSIYRDGPKAGVLVGAPTFNTGRHGGQVRPLAAADDGEMAFAVEVTMSDDPWVAGGKGTFTVRVRPRGERLVGAYEGSFRGQARRGAVKGRVLRAAHDMSTGEPPPRTELAHRAEKALADYLAALNAACRRGIPYDELRRAAEGVYQAAADVEAAVAAKGR